MRLSVARAGGIVFDCFLYDLGMVVYVLFPSRHDLCDDCEAVAGWSLGKDRTVSSLLNCRNIPPSGIAIACGFVQSRSVGVEGVAGATVAMSVSYSGFCSPAELSAVDAVLPEPARQTVLLADNRRIYTVSSYSEWVSTSQSIGNCDRPRNVRSGRFCQMLRQRKHQTESATNRAGTESHHGFPVSCFGRRKDDE